MRHLRRKEATSQRKIHPPNEGAYLPSAVSHSRPIFTSIRDFDKETAIWDSLAWSYGWKRLRELLNRQRNVFRDGLKRSATVTSGIWPATARPTSRRHSDDIDTFSEPAVARVGRCDLSRLANSVRDLGRGDLEHLASYPYTLQRGLSAHRNDLPLRTQVRPSAVISAT